MAHRYNLKHMLDVAHDAKVAGFILRGALGAQPDDAPLGSYVIVAVQHIEVCLKALLFASTGQVPAERDVLALYESLSAGEHSVLAQEFKWVQERTGSKLELTNTVRMARNALAIIRDAYEVPRAERGLDIDALRDLGAALDARIQALSGQTAQATRPLIEIKP
jgi:hypothetical protein